MRFQDLPLWATFAFPNGEGPEPDYAVKSGTNTFYFLTDPKGTQGTLANPTDPVTQYNLAEVPELSFELVQICAT